MTMHKAIYSRDKIYFTSQEKKEKIRQNGV